MTASERFDRDLGELMADLAEPRFPDYFDEVLDRAVATRQRPAWTFPERWFLMGLLTRRRPLVPALPASAFGMLLILALVLAVTVAIGVGSLLLQQRPAPPFGPAANGAIAYSQAGDIHTTDPRTGETLLVVGGPTNDVAPWFSNDGRSILFIRVIEVEPHEVIAVMMADSDGSDVRTLVEPEVAGALHWGELSPTGQRFAVINNAAGGPGLSVVDVVTGIRTPIDIPVSIETLVWTSDDEIVLHGGRHGPSIYAVRADGTDFRQISGYIPGTVESAQMQASHDGRYIAHASRVDGVVTIHLLDLQSGQTRSIEPPSGGHVAFPTFSPDGSSVAYVRYTEAGSTAQIVVAPFDSAPEGATEIGPRVFVGAYRAGLGVQFSPDGASLLITSDDGEVWLADLESGEYAPLDIEANESRVAWQRLAP
jgi:Tol biopolymer transport system component